ncbi:hypothetical protein [Lentzea flaviverrucosa]|uniref:CDP-Glycerol:Poly(Glycerophosphate) glycerophosphotransferase n=1 Tax=Lentzea flaviverrucosa TaxID=200379 RepID=A0A1H9RPY6_9PSEU|nr:hypothetical protein [Lentzea flaviverrucosa]RDI33097.1 hypothetical protein DFR72_102346 [Lentzea flaviverrucosa]SER74737.1 hypothetical protein SAMN05216195_106347 [Lentzea flaviverrucosa]
MTRAEWLQVPVGLDAPQWVTRRDLLNVLVVVHTVTSGQRLLELIEMVERDSRVQVAFTQAPDVFSNGVDDFLRSTGGLVLPWEQVIRERFDLAVTAGYGGLQHLHAPLLVVPHGAGFGKSHAGTPAVYGLDAQRLMHNGRVLPDAIVLSHEHQLEVLRDQCPPAVDVAVVAGDPGYDRMIASLPHRDRYRMDLGIRPEQELVVASSTWGGQSLFGQFADLFPRLLEELPGRHRVAALMHPAVWFGHAPRQVRSWLADCVDAGLVMIGPHVDWRAVVVAADLVIGDHGSVAVYASAIGTPVLLVDPGLQAVTASGSPQDLLRHNAVIYRDESSLHSQFEEARRRSEPLRGRVVESLTSRPGHSAGLIKEAMYRLLGVPMPGRHRAPSPVTITEECR